MTSNLRIKTNIRKKKRLVVAILLYILFHMKIFNLFWASAVSLLINYNSFSYQKGKYNHSKLSSNC